MDFELDAHHHKLLQNVPTMPSVATTKQPIRGNHYYNTHLKL